jgi:hypothetical protein
MVITMRIDGDPLAPIRSTVTTTVSDEHHGDMADHRVVGAAGRRIVCVRPHKRCVQRSERRSEGLVVERTALGFESRDGRPDRRRVRGHRRQSDSRSWDVDPWGGFVGCRTP